MYIYLLEASDAYNLRQQKAILQLKKIRHNNQTEPNYYFYFLSFELSNSQNEVSGHNLT